MQLNPLVNIIHARTDTLSIDRFSACLDQAWCILGSNHSGIHELFRLISKESTPIAADCFELPDNPGIISFKKQQEIYESELKKDDTDFMDKFDPGTLGREFIQDTESLESLIRAFDMDSCLDKGYRELSTGQSRKLMLLSEFSKGRSCFIIESPYDGLDLRSSKELDQALGLLHQQGILLILFVYNRTDIPSWCTHAGMMSKGKMVLQGTLERLIAYLDRRFGDEIPDFQASVQDLEKNQGKSFSPPDQKPLIKLNQGFAGYRGKTIFQGLPLSMTQGQHTLVTGPNGSGKSTLLQLITGDHPACYQNDLMIFGIQRGSGESIWDLKKDMGIVSPDLHRNYHIPGSALSAVISGYFDSIGIYRNVTPGQKEEALKWLGRIGLKDKAQNSFRDLSFSDQRLVLIARALIKVPKLLILDEPTQGLDELNRKAVLDFIEDVAKEEICTILYVSHREDEFREFFIQHIRMG
ncbi:MAG: ABC transporter [Desulfobacterales bacterium RIFOXYA12_FULL_46_15]|nr:MAG: ABC transporter [Desulfobacterales bacterium RIFOXYA12_FULL_46_15]